MKKFYIIVLSLLLVLLPLSVNGVENSKNYLDGLTWDHTFSCSIKKAEGLSVEATSITKTYSSPAIDIASAIKKAFNENPTAENITFKVGGRVKAVFKDNKSDVFNAKLIIRAKANITNGLQWKEAYEQTLNGDTPFFTLTSADTNALKRVSQNVTVASQWSNFEAEITVTKNNAFSSQTPDWYLCIDGIKLDKNPQTIYFEDMFLEVVSTQSKDKSTPTPTYDIPPRLTPTRTLAPYAPPVGNDFVSLPSATLKPTAEPDKDKQAHDEFINQPLFKDSQNIISLCIKGSLIIIIIAGFFAIFSSLFRRKK